MRLLVLAPRVIGADEVRAALPNDDVSTADVLIVTPGHREAAYALSGEVAEDAARALAEGGVRAHAEDDDPLIALHDAMAVYAADRIVVCDDGLAWEARERFEVPVTHGHLRR